MSSKDKSSQSLTEGDVKKHLLRLSWPMTFGILAVLSTSLVDTYFVGKLGTDELAALSFTFPVALAVNSISIGLGVGASSVISRILGSGNRDEAKTVTTHSLILSVSTTLIISFIGFLTIRPLFSLLGAANNILDFVEVYMKIWFLSLPMLVVPMVGGSIIRAAGDAFWPGFQMVVSALINVAVTPLFIFGYGPIPKFGIAGAAYGTSFAWFFTLAFALWLVYFKEELISFKDMKLKSMFSSWRDQLKVGLPSAASQVIHPVSMGVVTSFISQFGPDNVAAFGVGTRIESILSIPLFALSAGIPPIAGQNWGANKVKRVMKTLNYSYVLCIGWGLLATLLVFLIPDSMVAIFSDNKDVQEIAKLYVNITVISIMGYGFVMCSSAVFNAIDKPHYSFSYSFTRSILFYIPFSWLAIQFYSKAYAIFYAIALANVLSGMISILVSKKTCLRED